MKFSNHAENKNNNNNKNQNKRKIKEVTDPLFGTDGEMLMDNRKNPELLRFYFCIRFPH